MAVLTNKSIASTYKSVLSIGATTESALTTSIQQLTDGLGNSSPLSMSTTQIQFNNDANTFSFPADRGTSGQILKLADANGTLSWADDDLSNTLDFSGGTGTGSVTLDSQTLAFTGTANQIETSASSQAITLSFPTAGVTLPDGSIATTQTASDNSTKVATTAYVEAAVAAGGDVTKIDPITANQIAVWNDSTDELRSDETVTIGTDHSITLYQPNTNSNTTNYIIGGGSSMTTGEQNTGFGSSVLTLNTTGVGNVAIGSDSLTTNVSGNNNVAIGLETLKRTTASDNIAIGSRVLQSDTTGYENTAIGGLSQYNITTAYGNTSLGYNSLIYNSTGIQNTAIGLNSLKGVSTYSASNNTAIGYNSGSAITTGSYNVIIGSNTGSTIATSSSNIIISDGIGNIRQSFDFTGAATFSGNVGIGIAPSANSLHIYKSDPILLIQSSNTSGDAELQFFPRDGSNVAHLQSIKGEGSSLVFSTGGNSVNDYVPTPRLTISSNGLVTLDSSIVLDDNEGLFWGATSGSNEYIVNNGSDLILGTGGSPKLTITSGGNVGIGTDSPSEQLNLMGANDYTSKIRFSYGSSDTSYYTNFGYNSNGNNAYLQIADGGAASTIMTWNYDGNVGIGTDSPEELLDVYTEGADPTSILQIRANRTGYGSIRTNLKTYAGGSSATNKFTINFEGTDALTISSGGNADFSEYVRVKGDTAAPTTGVGVEMAYNATSHLQRGQIGVYDRGNSAYKELYFYANNYVFDVGGTPKLTITSGGQVFMNTTSSIGTGVLSIKLGGTNKTLGIRFRADSDGNYATAYENSSGTIVGKIIMNASSTSYETNSDYRLKENVTPITDALSRLNQLKPIRFNFIADAEKTVDGFLAHEVQDIIPEAISGEKDALSEDGTPKYQGIDQSKIVPLLTAAIQEQQTIIEDLITRLETLEG